jgi:hypothetical protein
MKRHSSNRQGRKCLQDLLRKQEKENRYLHPCLDQRRSFVPFVVSTDGLIGREAKMSKTGLGLFETV